MKPLGLGKVERQIVGQDAPLVLWGVVRMGVGRTPVDHFWIVAE